MTDDEIEALAKKHIAPHADRLDAIMANPVPYQQTEQFRRVKALIVDVLSQLRAPVADERAAFEAWATTIADKYDVTRNGDHYMEPYTEWVWEAWQARAAPASAPVAGEAQPVCWIEKDVLESVRDEGSDAWVYWRPAGHAAEPDEVPLYAAPQASKAVRDAEDAARWRWATASDGNADKLCSIVLCHGGYQDKINERADFYRAALSAQPGAQKEQSDA